MNSKTLGLGHLWAISFPHPPIRTPFAHKPSELPWIALLYVDKRTRCGWGVRFPS
jgi:hypothetical protein